MSKVGWVKVANGSEQQVPVWFDASTGDRICIGTGGYLRPVYRVEADRVTEVLGWIDTRQSDDLIAHADALVITEYSPREEAAS